MKISLVIPPLLQHNSPYPAVPVLAGFLRRQGHEVAQHDFSIEFIHRFLAPDNIRLAAPKAKKLAKNDERMGFFVESADDYASTVTEVLAFLQGKRNELAWRIAARTFLPEGPYFAQSLYDEEGNDNGLLDEAFGTMGDTEKARYLASLYLDDLTYLMSNALDSGFGLARLEEPLALSLPTMAPLLERLKRSTPSDDIIDAMTEEMLRTDKPDYLGLSVPFPGTLYGAFRIAQKTRELSPHTKIVLGGGYVNSELRNVEDKRIFEFFYYLCFDEGFTPWMQILDGKLSPAPSPRPGGKWRVLTKEGLFGGELDFTRDASLLAPNYEGLDLSRYFSVIEMPNKLHRIWSDGFWMKMQLASGCYWHRCAFCDLDLEYICHYAPARASDVVDAMQRLVEQTGKTGFHFVDEALSPALVRGICKELIQRKMHVSWWGNIRFDASYDDELAQLMADAGCIAVTGGLECANDRLLKLMNKGITLASARKAFLAFKEAGILVHAYLMYAFPTETQAEALGALHFVRDCFAEGLLHSAFWHRFALTAHSPIAQSPEQFGITLLPQKLNGSRFALNEIPYSEPNAPDWNHIGRALEKALYNYMLGLGLDIPVKKWLAVRD